MQYFVIEGTFKEPLSVDQVILEKAIKEHLDHLQKGFDEGWILLSGPKAHSGGGIIVMKAETPEEVEQYLAADPLKTYGIQDYHVVEFKLHDCQTGLEDWFK